MTTVLYFKNNNELNKYIKKNFVFDSPNTRYVVQNKRVKYSKRKIKGSEIVV